MKIAIADEQSHIRSALRLLISEKTEHCVVLEIKRTDTLLEELSKITVDLLIADWSFFVSDARATLEKIRYTSNVKHIVVLSSEDSVQRSAIDAGADDFLSKSEAPSVILSYLQNLNTSSQTNEQ